MKNRIAASIALAAGLALGASGCSLISHNGTGVHYAPSDGVEITGSNVALRNIILVADATSENFNIVFTAVNNSGAPADLSITLEVDGQSALVETQLPAGTTSFGNLEEDQDVLVAPLSNVEAGQSVEAFFTINGEGDLTESIPVLDGTLVEYQPYVLDEITMPVVEGDGATEDTATEEDAAAK